MPKLQCHVTATVNIFAVDDEHWPFDDETASKSARLESSIGSDSPWSDMGRVTLRLGGELRIEVDVARNCAQGRESSCGG